MKKSLQDKLKKYGTMAAAVTGVVAASDVDAQIVYWDVNPDSTFTTNGDTYNIDLNFDAIMDFQIQLQRFGSVPNISNAVRISPSASNRYLSSGGPAALNSNAPINSAASWVGGNSILASFYMSTYTSTSTYTSSSITYTNTFTLTFSSGSGNWSGAVDKYLGLEFQILGQTHYGWAKLSVGVNADFFTIKEYAYNATPLTAINAGDKGVITSINENQLTGVKAYIANQELNLRVPAEAVGFQLKLVDMLGRTIVSETIAATSSKINVSNHTKGVYVVLIEGGDKAYSQKLIIE